MEKMNRQRSNNEGVGSRIRDTLGDWGMCLADIELFLGAAMSEIFVWRPSEAWSRRKCWLHCLRTSKASTTPTTAVPAQASAAPAISDKSVPNTRSRKRESAVASSATSGVVSAAEDEANLKLLLTDRRLVSSQAGLITSGIAGAVTQFLSNCCETEDCFFTKPPEEYNSDESDSDDDDDSSGSEYSIDDPRRYLFNDDAW